MATETLNRYRASNAKLLEVALTASRLVDAYMWETLDEGVQASDDLAPCAALSPLEGLQVATLWAGLRAALIDAGIIDGSTVASPLPTTYAVFLRVQSRTDVVGSQWHTRACFELLMGVNSYGYADGAALDWFMTLQRAQWVRVLRQVVPLNERAAYLAGDLSGVAAELVIGEIAPGPLPVLPDGWAVIGDVSGDPGSGGTP